MCFKIKALRLQYFHLNYYSIADSSIENRIGTEIYLIIEIYYRSRERPFKDSMFKLDEYLCDGFAAKTVETKHGMRAGVA